MKRTTTEMGRRGETAVCSYLMERGYKILTRNYRIRGGEIDIIAQKEEILAFVEVKTRKITDARFPVGISASAAAGTHCSDIHSILCHI